MAIAIVARRCSTPRSHDFRLIIVGYRHRHGDRRASARAVKMTAMPQMVALFNGVGGGAAALVASSEFHDRSRARQHRASTR